MYIDFDYKARRARLGKEEPLHASRFTYHLSRFTHYVLRITFYVPLLAIGLLYVAALVAMPPEGLTHHDTGAKYLQVRNLRLTPSGLDWSINYPARSLDPRLEFVPFSPKQHYVDGQGRIYLQWPIFLGLLTRIPWKLLGFWGLYLVPLLAGLGTMWASYRLALAVGVPRGVAWIAVPLVGLATPISIYSLLFFEHTLASTLVTLSLLAAVIALRGLAGESPARRSLSWTALSGALMSVAIYFRSELYVLALVMTVVYAVMAWRNRVWRRFLTWALALALALAPLWAFYVISEGAILPLHAMWYFAGSEGAEDGPGVSIGLPALRYIASAGWRVIPDALFGPQAFPLSPKFPAWEAAIGLVGVALCALAALGRLVRPQERVVAWRLGALTLGLALIGAVTVPVLLSAQPYHNLHGFLLASPFVALALWPSRGGAEEAKPARLSPAGFLYTVVLLYVGLHTLIISALSGLGPFSNHEWGQRYLLPAYPALVVLALLAAWRVWTAYGARWRRLATTCLVVWAALALVGFGFSVRGYAVLRDERTQVVAWQGLASSLPDREPLLTDTWWLPLNLAADFYTRPIMLAEGDTRLAQWATEMKQKGVGAFGLMTANPTVFSGGWRGQAGSVVADGSPQEVRGMWLQRYRFAAGSH